MNEDLTKQQQHNLERLHEVKIYGVSNKLRTDLRNISKNLGISMSTFLKPKLREIAESYPAEMKKPLKN